MDMFFSTQKAKTMVYFCGGAGMNVALGFQDHADIVMIDTCDKNITSGHDLERVIVTEGTRGAGGNRKYVYPKVAPQIAGILEQHPAGDFNIVVFGGSGGTGSTVGPLIINELLKAGETVCAVMISGIESTSVVNNSIDTLKTLEGISVNNGKPLSVVHVGNVAGVPYEQTNLEVHYSIKALIDLTNQQHQRLDVMDVLNWLYYTNKLPQIQPQLSQLHICTNRQDANAIPEMISVASLYTDANREVPFTSPYISTTGIAHETDIGHDQIHFVINSIGIVEIMKYLNDIKLEQHRHQVKHVQRSAITDIDDNRNSDGFVL